MEKTKWKPILNFLTQILIVLVYMAKSICWLLTKVSGYFVSQLDIALEQLQRKENAQ